jgi:glycosyltransferase involved in cell wall biosynthesis
VPAAQALSLGALRNISLAEAHGSLVCQWDDDDLYHPRRLAEQARLFNESGCTAVFLRDVFQFVSTTRELFGTNWHATETGGFPGSLMCRHASAIRYPESGTDAALGEDRVVARQLLAAGGVQTLDECPWLFVYVSHGCNSWPDSHHRMLIERLAMSRGLLIRREASIREGLSRVDFGAVAVTVQGSNGPAFTIEGYTEISSS